MRYLDVHSKTPSFGEDHKSSIGLAKNGLQVLGVLAHCSTIAPTCENVGTLRQAIDHLETLIHAREGTSDVVQAYRKAAERHHREGSLEVDPRASVSMGVDAGAYVQAWIWVSDEEAGLDHSPGEGSSGEQD